MKNKKQNPILMGLIIGLGGLIVAITMFALGFALLFSNIEDKILGVIEMVVSIALGTVAVLCLMDAINRFFRKPPKPQLT